MVKKLLKRFYIFPLGFRRLFIAGILIFPFIVATIFSGTEGNFLDGILIGIIIYIILILIITWVYEGFKIENKDVVSPSIKSETKVEEKSAKTFDPLAARPWIRFWARVIDYALFLLLFYILIILLSISGMFPKISENILSQAIRWFVISTAILIVSDAALLSITATTPGKAIFSIKVLTQKGNNLTFNQALMRAFSVLASGFSFLIFFPAVPIVTMWISYKRIKNNGKASWDMKEGYNVVHNPIGFTRLSLGILLGLLAVLFISIQFIIGRQLLKEMVINQVFQK